MGTVMLFQPFLPAAFGAPQRRVAKNGWKSITVPIAGLSCGGAMRRSSLIVAACVSLCGCGTGDATTAPPDEAMVLVVDMAAPPVDVAVAADLAPVAPDLARRPADLLD